MEYAIPASTWFWLFVPMPLVVLISVITLFIERRN